MDNRYREDLNWASEHHAERFELYPNQWIAVYHQQVVAHGKSGAVVEQEAEHTTDQPETEIPVYYVDSLDTVWVMGTSNTTVR